MMIITFRCLLRLIFLGPETIETPDGKVEVRFHWRSLKTTLAPSALIAGPGGAVSPDPDKPIVRVIRGYAGKGCYIKVDE
jgi:hypothetical protein